MKYQKKTDAILLLEDGKIFLGKAIGKIGTVSGEICFNTGMTGYQEIFTDPSYFGQILVMPTSHIGNYGVHENEVESQSLKIAGLVCKKFSSVFSRYDALSSIQNYFLNEDMVGISEIDTRALVRYIRDKGAMNAIISSEEMDIDNLKRKLEVVPSMKGLELSSRVTTKAPYFVGRPRAKYKVAVLDLGIKKNILRCLTERDCYMQVFSMNSSVSDMLEWHPNGVLLTNGPGDPSAMPEIVNTVKALLNNKIPIFGICLGHQILALANGLSTYKMHNGHRGVNHPIKNLQTGKCEITSQNHGFVVDLEEAKNNPSIEITHIHLNDGTLAGLKIKDKKAFSVQFHPEASAGPHDSSYLFDQFIANMS